MKQCLFSTLITVLAQIAAGQPKVPTHVVVVSKGQVEFMRGGSSPFLPAPFGTELHDSDLIHLGNDAGVSIVCADLSIAPETARRNASVPCGKPNSPILYRQGIAYAPVRSSAPPAGFPVVHQPRSTRIRDTHPVLEWSSVPAAVAYKVSIAGTNWSTIVRGSSRFQYPATAPALTAGIAYRLVVVVSEPANLAGLSSDTEEQADLGFNVMPDDQAKAVHDAESHIKTLAVNDSTKRFLTALLYASNRLRFEAIAILEPLWSSLPEFAVARNLAELYRTAGLDSRANQWYVQALAHASNDEARGLASEGLAMSSPERATAVAAARQALDYFHKSNDTESAKRVEGLLRVINH